MANHKSGNDDFEYSGTAPSDVVYEQEAPVRSARYSVATLATTSVLVAVGLVGGAAFAISATLPAKQSSGSVQVTDGSGAATASTDASSPMPSPSSSATAGDDDSGHKLSGKTIAIPPAAFDDKDGGRDFHPAPQAGGTGSTAAPSAAPSAPSFGGGKGDREGDHREGEHHKPRPGVTPAPGASAAPNFGGGSDDEGEDD